MSLFNLMLKEKITYAQLYLFTLGTLVWAEMALIKKVTEKKVMFKSILSKVSHSLFQKFSGRGIHILSPRQINIWCTWFVLNLIIEKFYSHQLFSFKRG